MGIAAGSVLCCQTSASRIQSSVCVLQHEALALVQSHFLAVCHVTKATCKAEMACSVLHDLHARWSASFLGHQVLTDSLPHPLATSFSSFEDNVDGEYEDKQEKCEDHTM